MLSFASAGLRVLVFSLYVYIYTHTHTHRYIYVYISRLCFIRRLRIKPPISTLVGASWTFLSNLRDTGLRISQSQLYAPFRALFFVPILSFAFAGVSTYQVFWRDSDQCREIKSDSRTNERTNVQCRVNREKKKEGRRRRRRKSARASVDSSFLRGSNRIAPQSVCV